MTILYVKSFFVLIFDSILTYMIMKKIILLISMLYGVINLNAQCDSSLPVLETFDTNVINVCWDIEDGDGDSHNWRWWEFSSYYGGHKVIASYSMSGLTPDNWVISHAIDLTSINAGDNITLSWKVRGELSYAAHEYYTVYAALGNQTGDFQSSSIKRSEYTDEVGGAGVFVNRTLDISSLAGNTVYIAFRHHNTSNQSAINIDELSITTGSLSVNDFNSNDFKHFYSSATKELTLNSETNSLRNIALYNMLGQEVLSKSLMKSVETINLSSFNKGVYVAKVKIGEYYKSFKILRQ